MTAFFYNTKLQVGESLQLSQKLDAVYPLLNIPRQDLQLRRDIVSLLQSVGIDSSNLLYLEDMKKSSKSYAFLVDHNKITPTLDDVFDPSQVLGIIDHHAYEDLYSQSIGSGVIDVHKAGSCSSLVVTYFRKVVNPELFSDKGLIELALAPLLIDTSNMKSKVETVDAENYEFLSSKTELDTKKFFKGLKANKADLSGFSGSDIIRKDYKMWELPDKSLPIGISSVGKSLDWIYTNAPDFNDAVEQWATQQKLSVYACLTSFSDPSTGEHRREIAIWTKDASIKQLAVDKFAEISKNDLELEPKKVPEVSVLSKSNLYLFDQIKDRATRKQVAPLLRAAVQNISLSSL